MSQRQKNILYCGMRQAVDDYVCGNAQTLLLRDLPVVTKAQDLAMTGVSSSSLSVLVLSASLHTGLAQSSSSLVRDASSIQQIICPCDSRTCQTLTLVGDTASCHSFLRQSMCSSAKKHFLNNLTLSVTPLVLS